MFQKKIQRLTLAICLLSICGGSIGLRAQGTKSNKSKSSGTGNNLLPQHGRRGPGGPNPDQEREGRPFPPPGDQSFRFLSSEMRFGGKVVKGAPFTATSETEFVQTLGDGSKITRKNTSTIYRDSEGRTRREQSLSNIGPYANSENAPQMIFINDPVAGASYMLDPRNRTARKMQVRNGPPGQPRPEPQQSSEAKIEALGKQTIEGVEAEGTRSTMTIPVGKIGNERPLDIVSERWFSSVLQETILSKHRDPRMGEYTYRLTNINRSEPAASLFQVPTDYTISNDRPFGEPGMRGPMKRHDDDD